MRSPQGQQIGVICEHLGCLPSQLKDYEPTITDMILIPTYYAIKQQEMDERISSMLGGKR